MALDGIVIVTRRIACSTSYVVLTS